MKLTTAHLKEMVRDALKEQMASRRKPVESIGLPIHLYAHVSENGPTYHIESSAWRYNKPLPHGGSLDGYSHMDKKTILQWIKKELDSMEKALTSQEGLYEQMASNNSINTVAQGGKEPSLEEQSSFAQQQNAEIRKQTLKKIIKKLSEVKEDLMHDAFSTKEAKPLENLIDKVLAVVVQRYNRAEKDPMKKWNLSKW